MFAQAFNAFCNHPLSQSFRAKHIATRMTFSNTAGLSHAETEDQWEHGAGHEVTANP